MMVTFCASPAADSGSRVPVTTTVGVPAVCACAAANGSAAHTAASARSAKRAAGRRDRGRVWASTVSSLAAGRAAGARFLRVAECAL